MTSMLILHCNTPWLKACYARLPKQSQGSVKLQQSDSVAIFGANGSADLNESFTLIGQKSYDSIISQ